MPQTKTIKEDLLEMIAQFTDDYLDEWTAEGNELEGLHTIQDEFNLKLRKHFADLLLGLPSLQVRKSEGGYIAPVEHRSAIQARQEIAEALGVES